MKKFLTFFAFFLIAISLSIATPPEANDDSADVPEGGSISTLDTEATSLLANDTDAEEDPLTVNISPVSGPSHGSVLLSANGEFTYTHDGSETVTDSFVYGIDDGVLTSTDTATVDITVTPLNDAPIAGDDAVSVAEGGSI